jgi:hypothetical protein
MRMSPQAGRSFQWRRFQWRPACPSILPTHPAWKRVKEAFPGDEKGRGKGGRDITLHRTFDADILNLRHINELF